MQPRLDLQQCHCFTSLMAQNGLAPKMQDISGPYLPSLVELNLPLKDPGASPVLSTVPSVPIPGRTSRAFSKLHILARLLSHSATILCNDN